MTQGVSVPATVVCTTCLLSSLNGAVQIQCLTPSPVSPQPVGTTITWTVTAPDTDPGVLDCRFSFQSASAAKYTIVRDFHPSNSLEWTMSERDGAFLILATARNTSTGAVASEPALFVVSSRVTGATPVVNATAHPLAALYSPPPCTAGDTMRVRFRAKGAAVLDATPSKDCSGAFSMNFYVARLRANTTYFARHKIMSGGSTLGPVLQFMPGSIPPDLSVQHGAAST